MARALRKANKDNHVLLHISKSHGHMGESGRSDLYNESARDWAFAIHCMKNDK